MGNLLSQKKMLIPLVIAAFLFFLLCISTVFFSYPPKTTSKTNMVQPTPTMTVNVEQMYNGTIYVVTYPANWIIKHQQIQDGSETTYFSGSEEDMKNMHVSISEGQSQSVITQQEITFQQLGLLKQDTSRGEIACTMFSGTIHQQIPEQLKVLICPIRQQYLVMEEALPDTVSTAQKQLFDKVFEHIQLLSN